MVRNIHFKAHAAFYLLLPLLFVLSACDQMSSPTDPDLTARSPEEHQPPAGPFHFYEPRKEF